MRDASTAIGELRSSSRCASAGVGIEYEKQRVLSKEAISGHDVRDHASVQHSRLRGTHSARHRLAVILKRAPRSDPALWLSYR